MKQVPKCPKCPSGKDHGIIAATTRKAWFCCICGNYFENIGGVTPDGNSLRELIVLEAEEFRWTAEELAEAKDRYLAVFYSLLNDSDRQFFVSAHIMVHGDERIPKEIPDEDNPPDGITHRDTV